MRTREDLIAFVRSLPIPEERRQVVLLELEDHLFGEMAELEASGVPVEQAGALALASLGTEGELRRRLVHANACFQPLGPVEAVFLGSRIGGSFAIALVATTTLTALAQQAWWMLLSRNIDPQRFLPVFAAAMCAPIAAHFLLLRPWRLMLTGRRLRGENWPVVFLLFFGPLAVVSAAPIELFPRLETALALGPHLASFLIPGQVGEPFGDGVFATMLLGVWALHALWISALFLLARREAQVA